ncbi:MAG: amidohydrolase [Clostridia bacterium]|nr:amidohydrolase [Clostridia bacterium]MBR7032844.1 amidohydrolase [Clostridia bacterium]
MALFEVTENDKRIYEEELRDFLPDKILDVHTHVWLDSLTVPKPEETENRTVTWPSLVAKDDSIEDLKETYSLLFPGKEVSALMFTNEVWSIESGAANNDYVAEASKKTGWPALYYSHPTQSADEVEEMIRKGGFLGLKSYLDLAPAYIPEAEIRIYDFFPKEQLKRMDEMGAIVMLHIPRNGRLRDPVNLEQILEIKALFPNVRLIIAHIGRAYVKEDVGGAFTDYLNRVPDLMYDFTANCCEYAITEVIKNAGPSHVMFGTDMPILRMRTHRIEENGTYINLIPPGLYGDPSQDRHLREVSPEEAGAITFFAYEELLAFKRACRALGCTKEDVSDMMYGNAKKLIDGARRSIYGE